MPNWGQGGKDAVKWGATGAAVAGPVGGAIGAAGGFLKGLFTKKKKKPGEEEAGDPNSPENLLKAGASKKGAQADAMMSQGQEGINPAMQYYKSLIGEDPAALMDATRGDRGRVIDQYDAARRATATFGPRGGGTNAAIAESRTAQAGQLGDILASGKREAAGKLGELGTTLTGLGLTSQQLQSADLNSVLNAVLTREGFDIEKRGQTMGMWGDIGEGVGSIIGTYLGKGSSA